MVIRTAVLASVAFAVLAVPARSQDSTPTPTSPPKLKVFLLMGQSNMVGFGRIADPGKPGTLEEVCKANEAFAHWRGKDGAWVSRDDVYCVKTTVGQKQGWLAPGFGARDHFFGPELQFGHVMGEHFEEPVLIIKASQGNRSLGWDILPPGSERFEFEGRTYAGYKDTPDSWVEGQPKKEVNWYAGKQYDDFVRDIHAVLADLPKFFPAYRGQAYEVAGFGWWQGHKDQNAAHAGRYEQNLVRLIEALRAEFAAPKAPFVIATIGFGGATMKGHGLTVLEAQLAVSGERGNYPQFEGNVKSFDARPFWRDAKLSPNDRQDYHYFHNAETYLLVGQEMGRAMVELLGMRRGG